LAVPISVMSMYIYDFLDESVLPDVGDARITDDRILAELESYRSHALRSLSDRGQLSFVFVSHSSLT
jgi:hypothetical protein